MKPLRSPVLHVALSLVLSSLFAAACGGGAFKPGSDRDGSADQDRQAGEDGPTGSDGVTGSDTAGTGDEGSSTPDALPPPPDGVTADGVTPPPPPPPPDCASCREVLMGQADAADACTDNGPPSSAEALADLTQCTCTDSCAAECGQNVCAGGQPDQACQGCIFQNCAAEGQACFQDQGSTPPPSCASCRDVVSGQGAEADLCTDNGPPSSQQAFDDLTQCTCVDGCAAECGQNVCAGGQPDQACQGCIFQNCAAEGQACLGDQGPPPPPPSCATCREVIGGQGQEADLCTDNGPPTSQETFDALQQCTCVGSCANQCGQNVCAGGQPSNGCQQCIFQSCGGEAQACLADQR